MRTLIIALALTLAAQARGQEIFNQVVGTAKVLIDDPQTSPFLLNVARFKFTAMQYLCNSEIRRNGEANADFLNRQAYAMNHFVTTYFSELSRAQGTAAQKDVMKRYWQASAANPLFNDSDRGTTQAFINDPDCVTPFSLDTDWERADQAISR